MKRSMLLVLAGSLLVSSAAFAQSKSVAGTWNASVTTPNGAGNPTLTFIVKGDSVTGNVKRPTGEVVPLKGTIKGKDLTYTYTILGQRPGRPRDRKSQGRRRFPRWNDGLRRCDAGSDHGEARGVAEVAGQAVHRQSRTSGMSSP